MFQMSKYHMRPGKGFGLCLSILLCQKRRCFRDYKLATSVPKDIEKRKSELESEGYQVNFNAVSFSALPLSRTESPSSTSTRTHSMSPSSIAAQLNAVAAPPPPVVPVDSTSWEDGLFGTSRERAEIQPSPVTTSYPATPLSAASSQSYQFPNTTARIQHMPQYTMQPGAQNFPHTQDRPLTDAFSDANPLYDRRFQYPFQTTPDPSQNSLHAQSPTSAVSMPPQRGTPSQQQIQPPVNYAHKRSITEPNALRSLLLNQVPPSMSHLQQQNPRGPSPTSMSDGIPMLRAADFDLDPRGGRMPSLPS